MKVYGNRQMNMKPVIVSCRVSGCGSTFDNALHYRTPVCMSANQLTHTPPTRPSVQLAHLVPNCSQVLHDAGTIRQAMTHQFKCSVAVEEDVVALADSKVMRDE